MLRGPVHLFPPFAPVPPVGRVLAVHHVFADRIPGAFADLNAVHRESFQLRNMLSVTKKADVADTLQITVHRVEGGFRTRAPQDEKFSSFIPYGPDENCLVAISRHFE